MSLSMITREARSGGLTNLFWPYFALAVVVGSSALKRNDIVDRKFAMVMLHVDAAIRALTTFKCSFEAPQILINYFKSF